MATLAAAQQAREGPGKRARLLGIKRSPLAQFALFLGFALAVRCPAFGEWNYAVDDQFFALVGQRLLAGDTLYVDIWDRKPPLLYLTYAAIASISSSVLAYQLAATLFAALGAYGTARIARLIAPFPASVMAGVAYCALLNRFGGENGEAAVFYNPLIIVTAWSLASSLDRLRRGELPRRVLLGMLTAGLAIAYKQAAAFEAVFFGVATLTFLALGGMGWRGLAARATVMAALGALPMIAIGLAYWRIGHFPELWQAVVQSNVDRVYDSPSGRITRILALAGLLCLPLALAVLGYLRGHSTLPSNGPLTFLAWWAIAAIAAVGVFPNLYLHYALPLIAPLVVLGAPFFGRPWIGVLGFAAVVVFNLATADTFDFRSRWRARPAAAALVDHVRRVTPGGRLLVWGMPSHLYAELGTAPPSVLAFPAHMYEGAEAGASGIDEVAELRRILRAGPETVVVQEPLPAQPRNEPNVAQIATYVRHCGSVKRMTVYDHQGEKHMAVYSACAGNPPSRLRTPLRRASMEVGGLVGDGRVRAQRLGIARPRQLEIAEIGVDRAVADGMQRHRDAAAPAPRHGVMPFDATTERA